MKKMLWLLIVAANTYGNPTLFKVEGDSMLPYIKPGNTVITDNNVRLQDLRNGDVVVFMADGEFVVHRLHKHGNNFFTKGDNNNFKDKNYLSKETLIGKVIKVN